MKIVKVSTSGGMGLPPGLLLRQTPGERGFWGDCRFVVNQPVEHCDWWVVMHVSGLHRSESAYCDPAHIVYISMEPNDSVLKKGFLEQFSRLVVCDRGVCHPHVTYGNGTTWWVGMNVQYRDRHHILPHFRYGYDAFKAMACPEKMRRISVVCSKNKSMPGHLKRLNFLEKLKGQPVGKYIDIFGSGFNPIMDKWDSIAPYKYHITLENSAIPDYWTEKLGDAFLGFAFPIYYGCPNITDYFSSRALRVIDIENFEQSVATIKELIERDPYEEHFDEILKARDQVLDRYNIFQMMSDICDMPAQRLARCRLTPYGNFLRSWPRRLARRIIYRLRGIQGA